MKQILKHFIFIYNHYWALQTTAASIRNTFKNISNNSIQNKSNQTKCQKIFTQPFTESHQNSKTQNFCLSLYHWIENEQTKKKTNGRTNEENKTLRSLVMLNLVVITVRRFVEGNFFDQKSCRQSLMIGKTDGETLGIPADRFDNLLNN